ncbi:hypothetical protein LXL04_038035 [Taraxacum kok-saghyz]
MTSYANSGEFVVSPATLLPPATVAMVAAGDVVALLVVLTFHSSFQVSSLTVVIVFIIARLVRERLRKFIVIVCVIYPKRYSIREVRGSRPIPGLVTMGYPRDAPATVLFGKWFRFGKPSDQQFLFERTDGTRSSSFKTTAKQPSNSQAAAKQPSNSHQQKTDEGFNSKTGLNITSSSPKAVISKSIPKKPGKPKSGKKKEKNLELEIEIMQEKYLQIVLSSNINFSPAANPDRKSRKPQFQVFVDNQN